MWQVVIQLTKTWRELFGARSPGRRGHSWRDGAHGAQGGRLVPAAFSARPPGPSLCGCKPCVRLVPVGRGWLRSVRRPVPDRPPRAVAWPGHRRLSGSRPGVQLLAVKAQTDADGSRRCSRSARQSAPLVSASSSASFRQPCVLPASPAGAHRCARGPHAGFPRVNELTKAVLLPARAGRRAGRWTPPSVTPCHVAVPSHVSLHGSDRDPTFAKSTVLVLSWGDRVPFPGDTWQWGHGWVSWLWGLPLAPGGQTPGCR